MARIDLHRLDSELDALSAAGLGSHDFRHEAMARLRHVVPADAYCFSSADPATLVMTATASEGVDRSLAPIVYRNELEELDVAKHADLARGRRPVRVLAHETDGDPERSPRYRGLLTLMGAEHELRAAAIEDGVAWGFVHLYRNRGRRGFDSDEATVVEAVGRRLAAGVRAAELADGAETTPADEAPSLVLLGPDDAVVLATGAGAAWLARMRNPDVPQLAVPEVLVTLAMQARAHARRGGGETVSTRVRGGEGGWWLLHASCTDTGAGVGAARAQVAVIVQRAAGADLTPLLLRGLRLNAGETEVTELVLEGRSTKEIAEQLTISPWTVQDRLKQVFAKAGVRSRRELVARLHA
jgi:DNA-binding CsgD family transcriptional regulator